MNLNKNLIGYAISFISFIIPKITAEEIILFGSSARGEADKESDIDIFVNVKKDEKKIKETIDREINKFYKSKIAEVWINKGIKNIFSINVGNLDNWKLKRSIISDGIVLYGRYKETPNKLKAYYQFNLDSIKDITKRNFILRKLFGRKEKGYESPGIVFEKGGQKLGSLSFIVPAENAQEIIKILNDNKIKYKLFEFWSDEV